MNGRIWRSLAIYVLLMFVAISLVDSFAPKDQFTDMDFNQFLSLVEKGEISSITITDQKVPQELR